MLISTIQFGPRAIGEVLQIDGVHWRVAARNGHWLEVVDASESVEPAPPKQKYFAPSSLRDSFEKVNQKLERLGAQMEREYPFGGTCCRDCEWSGDEAYRKLSAKIQRVDAWRCVLFEKLQAREKATEDQAEWVAYQVAWLSAHKAQMEAAMSLHGVLPIRHNGGIYVPEV